MPGLQAIAAREPCPPAGSVHGRHDGRLNWRYATPGGDLLLRILWLHPPRRSFDALALQLAGSPRGAPVATPVDESSLEGRFQNRCRELIGQIRSLGFDPFVWVGLINEVGAVAAAKAILSTDYGVLPVTQWLVGQSRPELTLECEIQQVRWANLFNERDRARAVRRLASTGE